MITLDDILDVTCEVVGVERDDTADARKIDALHQSARVVYCRIAAGCKYSYRSIGTKINRRPQQVWHNVKNSTSANVFEYRYFEREVSRKLNLK